MKVESRKVDGGRHPTNTGFLILIASSASSNLVIPVFSLFLPLLALQLGANVLEIGLVGGAGNIVYSFMPFVMGRFANTSGARRFFIVSSLALLSVVSFLYFMANSPLVLILLRLFEGLGWATFWPAIEATLTHDPTRDPKRTLTIFNFSWSSAAAIGPLFGAFLVLVLSIRESFLATSVLLFATMVLNLIWIAISRRNSSTSAESGDGDTFAEAEAEIVKTESESGEEDLGVPRKVSSSFYFVSMALCAISSGILFSFFSPFARSTGISIVMIGVASFVFGFSRFVFYYLTIRKRIKYLLFHHNRRIRNVLVSVSVLSVSSLLITLPHQSTTGIYLISFAIAGAGYSIVYSISQVALLAEASPERMGTGAGLFESSIGVGAAAGPVIAGVISGNNLSNSFLAPSICLLPVLIIQFFILKHNKRNSMKMPA